MKKLLFLIFFLPTVVLAQTAGFTISGKIEGLKEGEEIKITSTQEGNPLIAKGVVSAGSFTVNGNIPEPGLFWLTIGNDQPQHIYLENSNINIAGNRNRFDIKGSQSHLDFDHFRTVFNPLIAQLNVTVAQLQQAQSDGQKTQIMAVYDSLIKKVNEEVGNFVTTKRSSYVSPFVLFVTAQMKEDPILMEQRYMQLDEKIRNSQIGKSLAQFIAFNKVGAVGTDALEFSQNDTADNAVSLSAFRGKYVLIDFWASWCKPCRVENPNVVKAYNKFKDKNFTILGVSLDQSKDAWVKAIHKDGLTWTNVSDLKSWGNAVAQQYRVSSIPQNFLIDPNGKIIAKNLRAEELEIKLCQILGCN